MSNSGFTITKQAGHSYTEPEKDAIFGKTGGKCTYCGRPFLRENHGTCSENPSEGAWEIDHWWPEAKDGPHIPGNLWPACCKCNDEKGETNGDEYILQRIKSNKLINQETRQKLINAGANRPKTGPKVPGGSRT